MNPVRSSPTPNTSLYSSFVSACQAWRGSTQKMTPAEAIQELGAKAAEIFAEGFYPSFEWLDRVNRLLWVLTSKGDVLLENDIEREYILRIMETAFSIHEEKKYKKQNPLDFARNNPRGKISLEEMLLQIHGRCKLLEELYINHQTSGGRIRDLTKQLRENAEEEKKLIEKLKLSKNDAEAMKSFYQQKLDEFIKRSTEENEKIQAQNRLLNEKMINLKSENIALIQENKRLEGLSFQVKDLEEELEKQKELKVTSQPSEIIVEVSSERDNTEVVKELKLENQRLMKEMQLLLAERNEVLEQNERFLNLKQHLLENKEDEGFKIASNKLREISEALKQTSAAYFLADKPESQNYLLLKFLEKVELILK